MLLKCRTYFLLNSSTDKFVDFRSWKLANEYKDGITNGDFIIRIDSSQSSSDHVCNYNAN